MKSQILTYVVKLVYSSDNNIQKISLISLPNGQLSAIFGGVRILGAGRANNDNGDRKNIRFLINEITNTPNQDWREKVLYERK
ncbi:hypothetical protein [Lysinibacillus yapensis]|uniref:hypothetical protein n=1 Tax=Ureibacillus yapensis TaxID=2304605 RepID=UPI000E58696F|nr:hypothetical protein [Lysinibacillus yapensis]